MRQELVLRVVRGDGALNFATDRAFSVEIPGQSAQKVKILRRESNGLIVVLWGDRVISGALTRSGEFGENLYVTLDGHNAVLRLREAAIDAMEQSLGSAKLGGHTLEIGSPIPGLVKSLNVKPGDPCSAGQTLIVLEAMKMENEIIAPHEGVVESVDVKPGQVVSAGALLARIKLP